MWSKEIAYFTTMSFLGLQLARNIYPEHCRGCQCEKLKGLDGSGADSLSDNIPSATQRLQETSLKSS